jgi:hypothetical protein
MSQEAKTESLRDHVLALIGGFLYAEKFRTDSVTKYGILEILNLISDYHEEGVPLFPEVIITNSLEFFKTIPNKELSIGEGPLDVQEFKKAIKLCAPLAIENWVIFIEVKENSIKYGLVSAEMAETSLSIYNQTVGELKISFDNATIAFIKNIGIKTVELCGLENKVIVSLTLDPPSHSSINEILLISQAISSNCDETYKQQITRYFEKTINAALRIGHGNLIAVVADSEEAIENLKKSEKNATFLPVNIDFQQLIVDTETIKNNETSINLKSFSAVLKAMINNDGITIFTNTGKLLGYHLLINLYGAEGHNTGSGTRSRAFTSMVNCNLFESCFYKSQDGNMKIWKKHE